MIHQKYKKTAFKIHVNSQLFKQLCSAMRYFQASCMQDTIQPLYDFWEKNYFISDKATQTQKLPLSIGLILKHKSMAEESTENDSPVNQNFLPEEYDFSGTYIQSLNDSESIFEEDVQTLKFDEEFTIKNEMKEIFDISSDSTTALSSKQMVDAQSKSDTPSFLVSDQSVPQSTSNLPPAPFMAKVSKDAVSGYNTFECTVCYQKFPNYSSLSRHRLKHTKAFKEYICWYCPQKFTRIGEFRGHMKQSHNEPYVFECPSCLKRFQGKQPLLKHELCCKQTKYECYFCGQMMNSYKELTNHSIGHYSCMFCGSRYDDICSLEKHERSHLPVFEYPESATPSTSSNFHDKNCSTSVTESQSVVTKTLTLPPNDGQSTFLLLTVDPESGALKLQPVSQDQIPNLYGVQPICNDNTSASPESQIENRGLPDTAPDTAQCVNLSAVPITLPFNSKPYTPIAPKPPNYSQNRARNCNFTNPIKKKSPTPISLNVSLKGGLFRPNKTSSYNYHIVKKYVSGVDKTLVTTCINCSRIFKSVHELDTPCYVKENSQNIKQASSAVNTASDSTAPQIKKCNLCYKIIEDDIDSHEEEPTIPATKHFCQLCGALFISKRGLNDHLFRAHEVKPYVLCRGCHAKTNPQLHSRNSIEKRKSNEYESLVDHYSKKSRDSSEVFYQSDEEEDDFKNSDSDNDDDSFDNVVIKSEPEDDEAFDTTVDLCEDVDVKQEMKVEDVEDDVLR